MDVHFSCKLLAALTVVIIVTILLNISSTGHNHRLNERKAGLPVILRVRSVSLPRKRNNKETSQAKSLHRLRRLLPNKSGCVCVLAGKTNNENISGILIEWPATAAGTHREFPNFKTEVVL